MPDRPAAPAPAASPRADAPGGEPKAGSAAAGGAGGPGGAPRNRWRAALRMINSRPVRWGFVAVAVALGGYAVARQWTDVRAALAHLGFLAVAGALLAVLAALLATMQVWRVLLAALGSPLPIRAAARIMFIGQLGKYLPGSIWPVLAQMELGTAHHVPRHRSATASVLTMLLSLFTGLLTALVTLPFVVGATPYLWAFLAAPVLLVCLHPRVLNSVLARLLRLAKRPALEKPLTGGAIASALAWAFASWVGYGLQLWLLATRVGLSYGSGAVLATGAFAFAWCVGFLVIFVPVGTGIREVLLVALLGPQIGTGAATAVALVSRVVLTAGDLLTAGAAATFSRGTVPTTGPSAGPSAAGQAQGQEPPS
jgi:glycosyltransferase 2 family protein